MSRRTLLIRPVRVEVKIPEDLHAAISLELYSELEGKVPYGKMSELVVSLLREWKDRRQSAIVRDMMSGAAALRREAGRG